MCACAGLRGVWWGVVRGVVETGGEETETLTACLELLFGVAAQIRLRPEILPAWFAGGDDDDEKHTAADTGDAFPLCHLLLAHVHHAGRTGDFARTGLLYMFEAAARAPALDAWLLASDVPTLMASGLGALYSQLARALSIVHGDAALPGVLALSDYGTGVPVGGAESAFSPRHRAHLATFLASLAFWQDVVRHTRGRLRAVLLERFRALFVRQLLYPSLLQSSDCDAGSAVAVLTYVDVMVEELGEPELLGGMVRFFAGGGGGGKRRVGWMPTPTRASSAWQTSS